MKNTLSVQQSASKDFRGPFDGRVSENLGLRGTGDNREEQVSGCPSLLNGRVGISRCARDQSPYALPKLAPTVREVKSLAFLVLSVGK